MRKRPAPPTKAEDLLINAGIAADADNPEWTAEDFRRAQPARQALPEIVGPEMAAAMRKRRGRPPQPITKVSTTVRIDPDVLAAFRATGRGWQTRINSALRDWLSWHGA